MNIFRPYFTPDELGVNRPVPQEVLNNMYLIVRFGLTPIRKKYGPTIPTSGWRTPEEQQGLIDRGYNPSPTSQHLVGAAVDFVIPGQDMMEVFQWLKTWWPGQCFYYPSKGHIHIGLPTIDLDVRGRLTHGTIV